MWNPAFRETVFKTAPHDVIQEMSVFNAVFNDWDRHPGNFLATYRDDRFHFASIDNESIENKGFLPVWGQRSYVPVFFTDDSRATTHKELQLPKDITLAEFSLLLSENGFQEIPRIKTIFNNLINRGDGHRTCLIKNGALSFRFHQGNESAFPLPKAPYSEVLVNTYRHLDRAILDECFQPLVALDPDRFGTRVSDILSRRDMFLNKE
jgi:hypothetical protein